MSFRSCGREKELSEVLRDGHWPHACDPGLREHVRSCRRCGDYLLLTRTFQSARTEALARTQLDHPSLLWWRAQLRRRNQALEQLARPTHWVGSASLLGALLVAVGFSIRQRRDLAGWLGWMTALPSSSSFHLDTLWAPASSWSLSLLVTCLGALVLLTAVALYLSSDQK